MKRAWGLAGGVALAALLAAVAPPLLRKLEFFRVRRVEVLGARYLTGGDVLEALALTPTASLFDRLGPAAERVATVAGVRQARISRRWPGTLVVHVEEREPVALVPGDGGLVLVDGDGTILPFDPTRRPADLPVASADSLVARLLARLREVEPELYGRVASARRAREAVVLEAGAERYLVRAEATADELRALAAVAADLARKGRTWRELDARFADRILVRGMKS
jgi:cell division protein FtsQ